MSVRVFIESEAEHQLLELDAWWRVNRLAAPDQVLDEFDRIETVLSKTPEVGRRYRRHEQIRWLSHYDDLAVLPACARNCHLLAVNTFCTV